MDAFLNIKYKQVSATNYEDFLKLSGLNLFMRKAALAYSPITILTKEGDVYTLAVSTVKYTFKFNEEFEEQRFDGTKVTSIVTIEGNKMIHVQTDANGKKSTNVREYSADKIVMTCTVDGWDGVCTRIFERIE